MNGLAKEYVMLIRAFLDGSTPTRTFEREFMRKFKSENRQMTNSEYNALNGTFTDLDCFDPEGLSVVGPSLDEAELRDSVQRHYEALKLHMASE